MAKQINCGICAIHGETVAMQLKDSFFKCPECGAETYVNDDGDDSFIRDWQRQQQYVSRSLQPGTHIVGGSDPVGTIKKGAMKKKSVSRLATELGSQRYY